MSIATLLFADNDPDFLKVRSEFLAQEGYHIITAANPTEARKKLEHAYVDLVILDIRLTNEEDEKDLSGLMLAREVARTVPKIILTGFPSYDYVREALKPSLEGLSAAVDFVAKQEGPDALLRAVQTALRRREVFVVHGHDEAARETLARFVEKLGLRAIILREQPNGGRAIIEKFEDHADVGFAIVLLTPDDVGGMQASPQQLHPRARQNVIFELGYFIGKLGRAKVAALYKEGVEIPSDYYGVLFISLDPAGEWRLSLANEMKYAGVDIDLNKAL